MPAPLVTVALPVRNAATTIRIAVASILKQTFGDWELIIVDDGSTDQTLEIVSKMQDARLRLVHEPPGHLGLAARLNQCVELARGAYFARMDGDDISYPRRLERQIRYFEQNPDIDLLGTGAVVFRGEGELLGRYPTARTHEEICRRPWWGFPLAHPTWMGRRKWFMTYPYREKCVRCEDQELLLRSYSHSKFSALEEVLLGYRMDGISVLKTGEGRLNYCRQLWNQPNGILSHQMVARGAMVHSLAFGRDLLLAATGTLNCQSRLSFLPVNDDIRLEWRNVWAGLVSK